MLKRFAIAITQLVSQVVMPASGSRPGWLSAGGQLVIVSGLLVTGMVTGVKHLRLIEPSELFVFDRLIRLLPDQPATPNLVIVAMTEEDIQQYGWPLTDSWLAELLEQLQAKQVSVIGLDIYRSSLRPPGANALIQQLAADNVIAIMNVGSDPSLGEVPPPPTIPPERISFNDFPVDADGIVRRSLLFVRTAERDYYSFALRVLQTYRGQPNTPIQADQGALYLGDVRIPVLLSGDGGYHNIDNGGYQVLLRYHSRSAPAPTLSVSQVLSGQVDPDLLRNSIVLVGTTAPSLKDQFYTPFSSIQGQSRTMSGVEIHAQMLSQLLSVAAGKPGLFRFLPPQIEILWLGGWCLLAGWLAWRLKHPLALSIASGVLLITIGGVGLMALADLVWLPMTEPMVGALATFGLVMARKSMYRSTHDALTGLPTRETFMAQVQQALQRTLRQQIDTPIIVAFLDINRFKVINESLGHQAGDQVLQVVAQRLQDHLPSTAKLARVGGDEYALLLQGMTRETAGQFFDQLQQAITKPFDINGQRLSSSVSVGLAVTQAGYDHRPTDLLRDAHTAMYRAKALGKSRHEVFAAGMLVEAVNRLQLESDLINALEKEEFLLYYQPIVRLETGKIAGFEALVRWQQQDRGFVMPGTFIPVAEETGLIISLGQWILAAACRQLNLWRAAFPQYADLSMSINLSNRQFGQADLVQQVESILQENQTPGANIRLEITESMVMDDVEAAIDLMLRLKSLQVKLGIDDFGTGYSSLSYLHRFPMDTLKVDKSFVGRMDNSLEDQEIVNTIVALGHKLGMEIVAEGIESTEQIQMLKPMGCEYGQGYYFARPLSPEAATELLRQGGHFCTRQAQRQH